MQFVFCFFIYIFLHTNTQSDDTHNHTYYDNEHEHVRGYKHTICTKYDNPNLLCTNYLHYSIAYSNIFMNIII